jgi:site-specific recombinase XerC
MARKHELDKAIDAVIEEMKVAGAVKDRTVWSKRLKRFGARIYVSSYSVSYFVNYRNLDRVERRLAIGRRPEWTADTAEVQAKEILRKVDDDNRDPTAEKRDRREAPDMKDLGERYIADHLPTLAANTDKIRRKQEIGKVNLVVEHLGPRTKVADVVKADIEVMHRKITANAPKPKPRPRYGNQCLNVASGMFSLSLEARCKGEDPWRTLVQGNPCKGVEKNLEPGKERFFSMQERAIIADAMVSLEIDAFGVGDDGQPKETRVQFDHLRLMALTGKRTGECRNAKWEDFDREPGFWCLPAHSVKQRKVDKVALNAPALELVDRLRKKRDASAKPSPYLFPSPLDPSRPFHSVWYQFTVVLKRAGIKNARPYDLRHSFASTAAASGQSLLTIGKLLGHSDPRTTQRYAHLCSDYLREVSDSIGHAIANAGNGGIGDGKVVKGPTWRR